MPSNWCKPQKNGGRVQPEVADPFCYHELRLHKRLRKTWFISRRRQFWTFKLWLLTSSFSRAIWFLRSESFPD
jgi:hypothetical protein